MLTAVAAFAFPAVPILAVQPVFDDVGTAVRAFTTLFVVMNSIPLLPVVASMTAGQSPGTRRLVLNQALLAGGIVAVGMVLIGPLFMSYIHVTLHDLRLAGGLVLLVFATYDLLFSIDVARQRADTHAIGIVPLGIPILMGPASLTTLLVQSESLSAAYGAYGPPLILAFLATNLVINWTLVQNSHRLVEWVGSSTSHAVGKIYGLMLAAIAVSMMRHGVLGMIELYRQEVGQ